MIVKLLTEHHLEFLNLKGGCRGSSESTPVKLSNCWKSHAAAHISYSTQYLILTIYLQLYEGFEVNGITVSKEETPGDDNDSNGSCSPGGDASTQFLPFLYRFMKVLRLME